MNKPSAIPIPMHAEGTEKKNHKKKCKNPRTCFGGRIPKGWFIHPLICKAASRFPNPLLIAGQFLQFCKDISVKCSSTHMISNYINAIPAHCFSAQGSI